MRKEMPMEKAEYDALIKKLYFPSSKQPEIIPVPVLCYVIMWLRGGLTNRPEMKKRREALFIF